MDEQLIEYESGIKSFENCDDLIRYEKGLGINSNEQKEQESLTVDNQQSTLIKNKKTTYPYYVAVRVDAGQLVKLYKNKKFESYNDCYEKLFNWFIAYPNLHCNGQYAIVEYTDYMNGKIITIFTEAVENRLLTPLRF